MLEQLKDWDTSLFVFLNSHHADWFDSTAMLITRTEFWIPLHAFIIFLIFRTYKKRAWLILAAVALTVLLADQFTSSVMKPYFQRLRPSHEPALESLVHIVDDYRGGTFGFASSHAADTFGVALFIFLALRRQYRWIWLMFVWALVASYSRVYLGVHYPGDILAGAIVGMLAAIGSWKLFLWLDSVATRQPDART